MTAEREWDCWNLTLTQRWILRRMNRGEHINDYGEGKYKLSRCGKRLLRSSVSALHHAALISVYRPGNFDLTPTGIAAAKFYDLEVPDETDRR